MSSSEDGMGLVCAGSVNQSFLARMPAMLGRLGPIKASSFRVARRICNSLHAGYAASHYCALEPCELIWVAVPELILDRTLHDLVAQTPLCRNTRNGASLNGASPSFGAPDRDRRPCTGLHQTMSNANAAKGSLSSHAMANGAMVVLSGCSRSSLASGSLQKAGARVATIEALPDSRERTFVVEGHRDTVRALRRLLAADRRKLIEIDPAAKPLFFAGVHMAGPLLLPWIATAMSALRRAGFTRAEAAAAGEALGSRALHQYIKAGCKAWNPQTESGLRRALECDLDALRALDPRLAEIYETGIRTTLASF
jgi:hypothetical protein